MALPLQEKDMNAMGAGAPFERRLLGKPASQVSESKFSSAAVVDCFVPADENQVSLNTGNLHPASLSTSSSCNNGPWTIFSTKHLAFLPSYAVTSAALLTPKTHFISVLLTHCALLCISVPDLNICQATKHPAPAAL